MTKQSDVSDHYAHTDLIKAIQTGLTALGKTPDTLSIDDLAPVDEFHIGGRQASLAFLNQLDLTARTAVLDIGCGLGGAARFVAGHYGSRVTGLDLTNQYIETGRVLCQWVGLDASIELLQGSALAMPFPDDTFDRAYMMHVGMNIEDKETLCHEVARVLRPDAVFGIYDVMRTGPGELPYPLPWATTANESAVAEPARYKQALQAAGFNIIAERNRRDFALEFFAALRAKMASPGGPPPLGLHILMGKSTPEKLNRMVTSITNNLIAPVEIIARKSA